MPNAFEKPSFLKEFERMQEHYEQIRHSLRMDSIHVFSTSAAKMLADFNRQQEQLRRLLDMNTFHSITTSAAVALNEFNRQQEQIKNFLDINSFNGLATSAAKMLSDFNRQQEQTRCLLDVNTFSDIAASSATALNEFNRQQEQIKRLLDTSVFHGIASSAARAVTDVQYKFNAIDFCGAISSAAKMASVYQLKRDGIEDIISESKIHTGIFNLLDSLDIVKEQIEENLSEKDFEKIKSYIDQKCGALHPSPINYWGMISVLLTIIIAIYQIHSSSQDTEALINAINKSNESIVYSINRLAPVEKEQKTFYVVLRVAKLRNKPTTKSPVIETLWPNQKVELIKCRQKWIYIEYFDLIEGVPKNGWVYKKYLKKTKM